MGRLLDLAQEGLANYELRRITAWLDLIGEIDPAIRAHVLNRCRSDPNARAYFLKCANNELPTKE